MARADLDSALIAVRLWTPALLGVAAVVVGLALAPLTLPLGLPDALRRWSRP